MEEQVIDVQATEVEENVLPVEMSLNEDKIKSPAEIRKDLENLKQLNKQLKKIKRYMRSPLHTVRQMDARV
jgi:predicted transcriptional regulator